jgi:predicted DNA-binding protein
VLIVTSCYNRFDTITDILPGTQMETHMADTTITIPAGSALDEELERVATATGHSKTDIVLEALTEWLEDQADAASAMKVLARNEPTTSLADMRSEFGLER